MRWKIKFEEHEVTIKDFQSRVIDKEQEIREVLDNSVLDRQTTNE